MSDHSPIYRAAVSGLEAAAGIAVGTTALFGFAWVVFPPVGRFITRPTGGIGTYTPWWGHGLKAAVLLAMIVVTVAAAILAATLVRALFIGPDTS
ncbi:hypothetical protein [Natrinema sp. DC36]|uniref:hypothetical protein n=1 Tax=Natrinema sp. DC36 TaxID=2878680 RepID=UPI001CF0B231|nr:hypothetical protein [Natrinema sp. DC36]